MAITIIFGLAFATALTLLVVPVLYSVGAARLRHHLSALYLALRNKRLRDFLRHADRLDAVRKHLGKQSIALLERKRDAHDKKARVWLRRAAKQWRALMDNNAHRHYRHRDRVLFGVWSVMQPLAERHRKVGELGRANSIEAVAQRRLAQLLREHPSSPLVPEALLARGEFHENISSADIIKAMLDLSRLDIDYKIAPPESASIIGSNSIHTAGDLYVVNLNAISKLGNKRKKRLFDLLAALLILCLSPVLIWFTGKKGNFIKNIFRVIAGKKSWIGYIPGVAAESKLPTIKEGVLNPGDRFPGLQLDKEKSVQLNRLYAKDYNLLSDIELLLKGWKHLDR